MKRGERRYVKKNTKENMASWKSEDYYLKKRNRKRIEMDTKFEKLKQSGRDDDE